MTPIFYEVNLIKKIYGSRKYIPFSTKCSPFGMCVKTSLFLHVFAYVTWVWCFVSFGDFHGYFSWTSTKQRNVGNCFVGWSVALVNSWNIRSLGLTWPWKKQPSKDSVYQVKIGNCHGYVRLRRVIGLQLPNKFGWRTNYLLFADPKQTAGWGRRRAWGRTWRWSWVWGDWRRKKWPVLNSGRMVCDMCVFLSFLGGWWWLVWHTIEQKSFPLLGFLVLFCFVWKPPSFTWRVMSTERLGWYSCRVFIGRWLDHMSN